MRKKIKIYSQILAIALLPAFVMRPVVVAVHNGSIHAADQQETKVFPTIPQVLSAPHLALRNIEREAPDVTVLVPRISKVKATLLLENQLSFTSVSVVTSPKSFLVLRI